MQLVTLSEASAVADQRAHRGTDLGRKRIDLEVPSAAYDSMGPELIHDESSQQGRDDDRPEGEQGAARGEGVVHLRDRPGSDGRLA